MGQRQRSPFEDAEFFWPALCIDPGRLKRFRSHDSRQGSAQHLSALTKTGSDQCEHRRWIGRCDWCRASNDLHERRIDLWPRDEHRGRHDADDLCLSPIGDLDADRSVGGCARGCAHSFADFALHHHQHPLDRWHSVEQVADQWCCDVVRQIGNHRPCIGSGKRRCPIHIHRVCLHDGDIWLIGDDGLQDGDDAAVDFDCQNRCSYLGQCQRQRTKTGPNFDHMIRGCDFGQPGNTSDRVGVGNKVLAELAARRQSVLGQKRIDICGRMHESVLTN